MSLAVDNPILNNPCVWNFGRAGSHSTRWFRRAYWTPWNQHSRTQ